MKDVQSWKQFLFLLIFQKPFRLHRKVKGLLTIRNKHVAFLCP